MTKPFKEKDIIQPLNDNYSLLIRFLFSDEMNIFMNSNIVTNHDNSVHVKNVGWVQFNYEDEVSDTHRHE